MPPRMANRNSTKTGGTSMKCASSLAAALMLGAAGFGPAHAQQGIDLVREAVAAQGGADALRALKAVTVKADGQHWEPGQSFTPGGEPRFLGTSSVTTTWDLAKNV